MLRLVLEVEFEEPSFMQTDEREDTMKEIQAACERGIEKAGYCATYSYWVEIKEVK
jgi:hypothetical protein